MKFTLCHTNINVKDIEKSLAFYSEALGLKCNRRRKTDDGNELVFLMDEGTTHHLQLTWLQDKECAYNLGDNKTHIAFRVDDHAAARELHEKMGCICYTESERVYYIADPDGYWLEILPTWQ